MKNFLKSNGYYLILVVCVLAVCIAGIAILENKTSNDADTALSYTQDVSSDADPVSDSGGSHATGQANPTPTAAASPSNSQSDSASSNSQITDDESAEVSKPVTPEDNSSSPTEDGSEVLTMTKPLSGEIINEFSAKKLVYNKTLKEWRIHPAIDIAGSTGENVICAMAGTVSDIKNDPLYGNTVIIDNGKGTQTVYCGIAVMNNLTVGTAVNQGDTLGTLGDSIFSESESGTHLHFEVIQNGTKVDPTPFFNS